MESISLTFTQKPMASQQMGDNHDSKMPPIFGADSTQGARLEPSILGSIIPTLDPAPAGARKRNSAFVARVGSPPTRAGVARPVPSPAPGDTAAGPTGAPALGQEGPRDWAGGSGGGGVAGTVRGPVAGLRGAEVTRRRPRVKHGLRVLLRGTSRCGKSTILWDYCHRAAMAGHRVVLVCLKKNEGEDLSNLPRSMRARREPGGGDELRGWEAAALSRIGLKYVRSRDDLAWYLGSLHTLDRRQWPTVIAVDDLDKIIEASVVGSGGGGSSSGGSGSAALRILALLQDAAEFFDKSRGETSAAAAAAASSSCSAEGGTPAAAIANPQNEDATDRGCGGGTPTARQPLLPPTGQSQGGNREGGYNSSSGGGGGGGGGGGTVEGALREGRVAAGGGRQGQEEAAVRVVGTCSTSDRGMLSLYSRFVHAVARVQNTTGPDCFSLRLDPAVGTAPPPYPLPRNAVSRDLSSSAGGGLGFAPGFTPWDGGAATNGGGGGGGGDGGDVAQELESVGFVRSQLDGSFSLF